MAHTPDIRRRSDRPDRRMEDVIVRAQPNAGAGVLTRSLPSGTIIEAFPKRQHIAGNDHPFKLSLGQDEPFTIKVRPGLFYLSGQQATIKINNILLTDDPPPFLSIGVGTFDVCIRYSARPVWSSQNLPPGRVNYISGSSFASATVPIIAVPTATPPADEKNAEIDYYQGTSTDGVYYIALGRVVRTSGKDAALSIQSQYWKTNIAAAIVGDGSMFYQIR